MTVEAGVPLFDDNVERDAIWVYYPRERYRAASDGHGGWVCDVMTVFRGEVNCRAGLRFSDRYLSSLYEELPK